MPIPQNITKEQVIMALNYIDSNGVPERRKPTKFYIEHEGNFYPPKYVLSIANRYANGQELESRVFSGGIESNDFLAKLGFQIVEVKHAEEMVSHSWTITSAQTAIKKLDKSAFLHRGTGVPVDIRGFFNIEQMKVGDKKEIILVAGEIKYAAYLSKSKNERTRLFWYNDFAQLLKDKFKTFEVVKDEYEKHKEPLLRLKRSNENAAVFYVTFGKPVDNKTILMDIDADFVENGESEKYIAQKEGALKQYYSKRYERDPKNRKSAIELHGTVCVACGFDFEKVYGERGKDFIEVHHTKPLSLLGGEESFVDPLTDLVPVCSNCHRMIHRRQDDVLTIDQLKALLTK